MNTGRIVRMAAARWLLAASGAIAACGPGLHALPGLDHAHHDRDDGPTGHPGSHDDCPACQLTDQGQLPVVAFGWEDAGFVRPCQPPLPLPVAAARPLAPPSLRGPPRLA